MRRYIVIGAVILFQWSGSGRAEAAARQAAASAVPGKPAAPRAALAPAQPKPTSVSRCNGMLMLPGAPMAHGRSSPAALLSGDWNGDGKLDLATANALVPELFIRLSNGNGTFQPEQRYPLSKGAVRITSSDFNGDGRADIATANRDDATVSLLLGKGDGTFAPAVNYGVGKNPHAIGYGDFNGDRKVDLVTASETKEGTVSVLLGRGDGTFRPAQNVNLSPHAQALTVGDFNRDGKLDVVTTNDGMQLSFRVRVGAVSEGGGFSVQLLLGNGDGSFQAARPYQLETNALDVASADVNRDGNLDLITANQATGVSILLGQGNGSFAPARSFSKGTINRLTVGDWNGDGKSDVAFFEYTDYMQVLLGNGDGTLKEPVRYPISSDPGGIAGGDWNGDGKLDLAVSHSNDGNIIVFLGNGDGTFPKPTNIPLTHGGQIAVAADLNGDGRLDLITVDNNTNQKPNVSVLLRSSEGLREAGVYTVGWGLSEATPGDWNGDGKLDLIVSSPERSRWADAAYLLVGSGDGTFKPAISLNNDNMAGSRLGVDVNADGKLDLITAPRQGSGLWLFLGKGDGTFQPGSQFGGGHTLHQIISGDWNRDGKLDLATLNRREDSVSVFLGNGDGTFKSPAAFQAGGDLAALASGDWNGDGKPDIAAITGVGTVLGTFHLLLGQGDGTFGPPAHFGAYHSGADKVVGVDLNGDGKLDLVMSSRDNNKVTWLRGNGDGTFAEPVDYGTDQLPTSVFPMDWNDDGRPDLVLTHAFPRAVSILLSSCR